MAKPSTETPSAFDDEDNSNNNAAEFFKIFLPEIMTNRMRIPPVFVKKYRNEFPKNAIIKNIAGHCWHVKLDKIEGNLFINEGWEKFAREQFLEFGDFLLFRYNGNHLFMVKVFGRDGCKKKEMLSSDRRNTTSPRVIVEPAVETVEVDTNDDGDEDDEDDDWSQEHEDGRRRYEYDSAIIHEKTFHHRMTYYFTISGKYVTRYGINLPGQDEPRHRCFLCNRTNGDREPVLIYRKKDGRIAIGSGWKEFWVKNNIMQGDKCRFGIVLGEGRKIKEILVEVVPEN